jgi:hypothetical protein
MPREGKGNPICLLGFPVSIEGLFVELDKDIQSDLTKPPSPNLHTRGDGQPIRLSPVEALEGFNLVIQLSNEAL